VSPLLKGSRLHGGACGSGGPAGSYAECAPELVLAAKRLHRCSPKGGLRSLREIAAELATRSFKNGKAAVLAAVKSMVEGPTPAASQPSAV
jgi:hypothetical protein